MGEFLIWVLILFPPLLGGYVLLNWWDAILDRSYLDRGYLRLHGLRKWRA